MFQVFKSSVLGLLFGLCLLASPTFAAPPMLSLDSNTLVRPVAVPAVLVLEDPSASLTAGEVLELIEAQGVLTQGTPLIGYSASAWWLAFRLDAPAAARLNLIIAHPFLDDLEVWLYDRERLIAPYYSGDHRPFLERGEPYPHFMLSLPRFGQGPHTLLLRVQSGSSISLPMQVVGAEQSSLLLAHDWLQSGLLLGALLSLMLFYMIKFSTLREPQLLWFCLTLFGVALYNAAQHGLVALWLPQWPWLPMQLTNLANPVMMIFSSLFLISALRLKLGRLVYLLNGFFALILLICGWTIVRSDQPGQSGDDDLQQPVSDQCTEAQAGAAGLSAQWLFRPDPADLRLDHRQLRPPSRLPDTQSTDPADRCRAARPAPAWRAPAPALCDRLPVVLERGAVAAAAGAPGASRAGAADTRIQLPACVPAGHQPAAVRRHARQAAGTGTARPAAQSGPGDQPSAAVPGVVQQQQRGDLSLQRGRAAAGGQPQFRCLARRTDGRGPEYAGAVRPRAVARTSGAATG